MVSLKEQDSPPGLPYNENTVRWGGQHDHETCSLRGYSCDVVRSMSMEDSVTTTRWLFIAMSRHPSLVRTAQVSDADGLDANRRMGALVNRLLFDTCAAEARTAFQSAGQEAALEATFGTLGEKAMTDLMGNPDVLASVIQLGAYVDQNRLEALTQ